MTRRHLVVVVVVVAVVVEAVVVVVVVVMVIAPEGYAHLLSKFCRADAGTHAVNSMSALVKPSAVFFTS